MDLHVTLAGLIDAKLPDVKRDGGDVAPLLFGTPGAKGRDEFWFTPATNSTPCARGDWKLHVPHDYLTVAAEPGRGGKPSNFANMKPQSIENSGIRGIASRHGYRVETIGLALYNVTSDPGRNAQCRRRKTRRLSRAPRERVSAARADLGDALTRTNGTNIRPAGDVRTVLPAA